MAPQNSHRVGELHSGSAVFSGCLFPHLLGLGSPMRYFGMASSTFEHPKRIHI